LAATTRPHLPKINWGFLTRLDLLPAAAVVAGLLNLLLAWWLVHPRSFRRAFVDPHRRRKLTRWYAGHYFTVMDACGLSRQRNGVATTASLLRVQLGPLVDRLLIGLMVGQSTTDIEGASDRLAAGFGAQSARVFVDGPNTVWLELAHGDALAEVIPPLPIAMAPNFDQVPIGVRAAGCVWALPVLGSHCFIAGATGSGKGSVIWSMLRGLAGPIHDGTAQVWAVDPKGGMELGLARGLFTRFAATSSDEMCELLEDAVDVMDARCAKLAGRFRVHQPSTTEPLILVLVDELASLTAYEQDRKLRDRATAPLSKLLTKGRAAGVSVVAAAQDPRKEIVSFRSLFPTKVALRLGSGIQVDMVLGEGMHGMGARCDRISASTPGVGYVSVDGIREPMRVRASWVDDDSVITMSEQFAAPPAPSTSRPDVEEAAA